MISINLENMKEWEYPSVYAFFMKQKENEFEIIIERDLALKKEDAAAVHCEYYFGTYAGHLLSEIAQRFAYCVPSEYDKKPFRYEISVNDLEELAELIYKIISGIYWAGNKLEEEFIDQGCKFLTDESDGKVYTACEGLLQVCDRLIIL